MIPLSTYLGTVFALLGAFGLLLGALLWFNHRERADLLNRLMARDLVEYQSMTEHRAPPKGRNHLKAQMEQEGAGAK